MPFIRPPQIKKNGKVRYQVKKGKDGYLDATNSASDTEIPKEKGKKSPKPEVEEEESRNSSYSEPFTFDSESSVPKSEVDFDSSSFCRSSKSDSDTTIVYVIDPTSEAEVETCHHSSNPDVVKATDPKPEVQVEAHHHSSDSDVVEGISLRVKESWDKDIHYTKEIESLLKAREQYFSGQLDQACYETGPKGELLYFPSSTRFLQRSKDQASSTSQQAAAPDSKASLRNNRAPRRPQTAFDVSNSNLASDEGDNEVKVVFQKDRRRRLLPVASVEIEPQEPEPLRPWDEETDPIDAFHHVEKWVAMSREGIKEVVSIPTVSSIFKAGELVDSDDFEEVEEERSRLLRSTVSSALKSTQKYDMNNFIGKKALQAEMNRCGISRGPPIPVALNSGNLDEARVLLRQAEQTLWASRKQELLRHRKNKLGYKQETKRPVAKKPERSMSERELAIKKLLAKPLPPSKLDFSHGDGVLHDVFALIKIDPKPLLDLKPKMGGRKGIVVPTMASLRQKAKLHAELRRSEPDLLAKLIPANYPRKTYAKKTM